DLPVTTLENHCETVFGTMGRKKREEEQEEKMSYSAGGV
ncbi:hypothetical protein A2U01_0081883, partial [Trifolium medium]|nr:hypothetical protein [Trifolium medium]